MKVYQTVLSCKDMFAVRMYNKCSNKFKYQSLIRLLFRNNCMKL